MRSLAALDGLPFASYARGEVLRRLAATLATDRPIIAAGSSCGLVAK